MVPALLPLMLPVFSWDTLQRQNTLPFSGWTGQYLLWLLPLLLPNLGS